MIRVQITRPTARPIISIYGKHSGPTTIRHRSVAISVRHIRLDTVFLRSKKSREDVAPQLGMETVTSKGEKENEARKLKENEQRWQKAIEEQNKVLRSFLVFVPALILFLILQSPCLQLGRYQPIASFFAALPFGFACIGLIHAAVNYYWWTKRPIALKISQTSPLRIA